MADAEDFTKLLQDHPIFSLPKDFIGTSAKSRNSLELSTNTLPDFTNVDPQEDSATPSGRRQTMILKDADLIVAAGKEIRMSSLGDVKLSQSVRKSYKTMRTPNLQFEIHHISLNPSGKLLAVAGAFQVAVIVLPRAGYSRLVPELIDCKSIQVGQFYHAASSSAAIAKIDWHPWGEAGSTLLVMTVDGKLREYDISVDTEEPQQVLTFVPEKKSKSFMAEDDAEREVVSFTLGKGRADWGPLTIYAVVKSGDIYAISPYMPQNASIPSIYVHSLECFISAKQEYLSQGTSAASKTLSTLYDYQRKYVTALIKQLPPGTVFPAASRSVLMHPPTTIKPLPLRQGPFLLQPSPRMLDDSIGGDATDITYLAFGTDDDDPEDDARDTEHLGVMLVAYQDGKVDLLLDVEKVEARWDVKQSSSRDLPMLAVYETIDLGLVSTLKDISVAPNSIPLLELLQGNHPVFISDPLYDDMVYVYHAFGVHALDIAPVLQCLTSALRTEDENEAVLKAGLEQSTMTNVQPILNTFSVERKCSNPVIAVTIPNDVYLNYSILILTSAMRATAFPLNVRSPSTRPESKRMPTGDGESSSAQEAEKSKWLIPVEGPPTYVSLLGNEPYQPPPINGRSSGLPTNPKLTLPPFPSGSKEFMLTPDTLRFLGTTHAQISSQAHEVQMGYMAGSRRLALQQQEITRLSSKCKEIESLVEKIKGPMQADNDARVARAQEEQKRLLARLDRMLQEMMERASPELSEHETKWFEELKRMKGDIVGSGRYDEGSLKSRTRMLEREYARLLPLLQALAEKERLRDEKITATQQNLGFSQAFEYGERSNLDRTRIASIEKQVTKLATRIDLPLGRPPPSQA
ncbi:hypothetical protein B0H34DRAFT_648691 [Crassisporium funariophilum]|nr:hypothetical protein B0H34DRAFT_648691 [Crassisporium funariophilum]